MYLFTSNLRKSRHLLFSKDNVYTYKLIFCVKENGFWKTRLDEDQTYSLSESTSHSQLFELSNAC